MEESKVGRSLRIGKIEYCWTQTKFGEKAVRRRHYAGWSLPPADDRAIIKTTFNSFGSRGRAVLDFLSCKDVKKGNSPAKARTRKLTFLHITQVDPIEEKFMSKPCFPSRALYLFAAGSLLPLAVCAQTPWYLGASGGRSSIRASSGEVDNGFLVDDGFTARGTTLDKQDTGWKLYGGYRFNRFFAAEGGYVDLGKATFNTTIVAAPASTTPAPPFPIDATAKAHGVFLAALAQWPITTDLGVFAKFGAFRSEAEFTEVITTTGATRVNRTERKTAANFGLGLQWTFAQKVGVRIELERFRHVGRGIGGREGRDVDFASVGALVRF